MLNWVVGGGSSSLYSKLTIHKLLQRNNRLRTIILKLLGKVGWEDVTKTKPNKKFLWPSQTNNIALCVYLMYDHSMICVFFKKKAKTNNTHTNIKRIKKGEHLQSAGNLSAIPLRRISTAACSISACCRWFSQ